MKRLIATTALALVVAAPAYAAGMNADSDAKAETGAATPPAASMPADAGEPSLGEKTEAAAENAAEETGEAIDHAAEETGEAMDAAGQKIESAADAAATEADKALDSADAELDADADAEGWANADASDVTSEELEGVDVFDASNEDIGEVVELTLGEDGATVNGAVIDVGGFLGLGEHRVALSMDELKIMRSTDDADELRVYVSASREQLESMPEYEG